MYAVKVAGKGHHRFFQPELFETIRNRRRSAASKALLTPRIETAE